MPKIVRFQSHRSNGHWSYIVRTVARWWSAGESFLFCFCFRFALLSLLRKIDYIYFGAPTENCAIKSDRIASHHCSEALSVYDLRVLQIRWQRSTEILGACYLITNRLCLIAEPTEERKRLRVRVRVRVYNGDSQWFEFEFAQIAQILIRLLLLQCEQR